jgi:hypothetical protein
MSTYLIGESPVDLHVIGAGLRYGWLPPRLPGPLIGWDDLDTVSLSDLEAFEAAGWRFHPQADLNWRAAEAMNGGAIQVGLLAKHSWGGLVILPNHLVVSWPEGTPPPLDGDEVERLPLNRNVYDVRMRLPDSNLEGAIVARIAAYQNLMNGFDQDVAAEPMLFYHLVHRGVLFNIGTSATFGLKTDPTTQWHWDNIHVPDAWDKGNDPTRRGKGARVAVIDRGFDINNTQIKSNIAETAFLSAQGSRLTNAPFPTNSHGTLCAGLVGAVLDGVTVNGAAPECTLMLVAVEKIAPQVGVAKAIELATGGIDGNPGADVISCSIGPTARSWELSSELANAIRATYSAGRGGKGLLIVWADFDVHKPIRPNSVEASPDVLCVGQNNSSDQPGSCGFGPGLSLLAPGVNVTGITGTVTGASCSAPIVAGVAALALAKNSGLNASQLAKLITDNCDRPLHPNQATSDEGWGRLNAARAIDRA